MKTKFLFIFFSLFLLSCDKDDDSSSDTQILSYDFATDAEGWIGDFADYPVGEEELFQLQFEHTTLPDPLDNTEGALMFSGLNHSDDLFMFLKRKITGLSPNTEYSITFTILIATNESEGQFGIGGSPGESVFMKVGATTTEPDTFVDTDGRYRMNIDKQDQGTSGTDMINIGNFSNGTGQNVYTLKTLSNEIPFKVQTDAQGNLWVIVGTDSGFEGVTTIYYDSIELYLSR